LGFDSPLRLKVLSTVDKASERWVSGLTHIQTMSGSSPELAT